MDTLKEKIEHELDQMMMGAENFFGAQNLKRAGHISCALDRIMAHVNPTPLSLPWDAAANYHYEPVEKRAAEIYATYPYDGDGEKPAWAPHGNSLMQDRARQRARAELRAVFHQPS